MTRKKWTPQVGVSESMLQLRERRKWQIALRRYVLEGHKSRRYAPYFGLPVSLFRQWIELQFGNDLNWDNFSAAWQFEHVVPLAMFRNDVEEDLRLCWHFTNIRVERIDQSKSGVNRMDLLAAKNYFENLFRETGLPLCAQMLRRLEGAERENLRCLPQRVLFIQQHKDFLKAADNLTPDDYERLNAGTALKTLLFEKAFLKKLGE